VPTLRGVYGCSAIQTRDYRWAIKRWQSPKHPNTAIPIFGASTGTAFSIPFAANGHLWKRVQLRRLPSRKSADLPWWLRSAKSCMARRAPC